MRVWRDLFVMFACVLAACLSLVGIVGVVIYWSGPACITESQSKVTDLSGFDFEVATTYCSGFGASARTKVWARKKGDRSNTLLFEYDPIYRIDLPAITIPEKDTILISVSWVAQIFARRHVWRGMRIDYQIGKVTYAEGDQVLK